MGEAVYRYNAAITRESPRYEIPRAPRERWKHIGSKGSAPDARRK